MINSKTLTETDTGPKANVVPLPRRMQLPLAVRSSGVVSTVKRCSMVIIGLALEEATVAEAEDKALEAEVATRRWVSATGKGAGLTVGTDLIGVNMAITEDLAVGKTIHNGNRSIVANMQKGK